MLEAGIKGYGETVVTHGGQVGADAHFFLIEFHRNVLLAINTYYSTGIPMISMDVQPN